VAEITAILDGKRVIAPPRQIQEVRNAIKAYDRLLPIAGPDQTGSGQAGLDQQARRRGVRTAKPICCRHMRY